VIFDPAADADEATPTSGRTSAAAQTPASTLDRFDHPILPFNIIFLRSNTFASLATFLL
jgi:hypothetical protein